MDLAAIEVALRRDGESAANQRTQLRRELDEIIAASMDVATDDEHDPEGATIAYERARVQTLLDQTKARLVDISVALEHVRDGTYGICVDCGTSITPERLEARPATRICIACASGG